MRIVEFFEENNYTILDEKLNAFKKGQLIPPNVYCVSKA